MSGVKLPLKMQVAYIRYNSITPTGFNPKPIWYLVKYCFSFSAHTDFKQTSGFIRALKPPHVVLVHGEANEMNRLKSALVIIYILLHSFIFYWLNLGFKIREYEGDPDTSITFHSPRNTTSVELFFRGEKMAKVMGSLAVQKPGDFLANMLFSLFATSSL